MPVLKKFILFYTRKYIYFCYLALRQEVLVPNRTDTHHKVYV
jgi:hypothetical protein